MFDLLGTYTLDILVVDIIFILSLKPLALAQNVFRLLLVVDGTM